MADDTSQDDQSNNIDWEQRYRNFLEKNRGKNIFADMRLALLDRGLSLHVPKPLTPEVLQKFYDAGIVKKEDLVVGEYYWGSCRNASLAMWTGECFVHLRTKFDSTFAEKINHLEDDNGYDLFIPIKKLTYIEDVGG
jgi:hypothetical protein